MGIVEEVIAESGINQNVTERSVTGKQKEIQDSCMADYENMDELAGVIKEKICDFLSKYKEKSSEEIRAERYARFRKMGTEFVIGE